MRLCFWSSFAVVAYAYFGYAIWLWLLVQWRRLPILCGPITPQVSIIVAVHNEETNLPAKLTNLRLLDYPVDRLQIVVVSDGSTDGTVGILRDEGTNIVPVIVDEPRGKANALNQGVRHAEGEVLVFLDVRQYVELDAVAMLVSCFVDPTVGAVSGELLLEARSKARGRDALGIYWKIEKVIRKLESASGSVVGVTGAIYAMRRELYKDIPEGTILDDVFVPMNVVHKGKRVVFQPFAIARDKIFEERGKEFSRKVRTLSGNYQLLRLAPWLLSLNNPLLFRFVSHKLLRLIVPLLLAVMLSASAIAKGLFYETAFVMQILFYVLAALGALVPSAKKFKPVAVANTFVMLNAAATIAFYNFVMNRKDIWA